MSALREASAVVLLRTGERGVEIYLAKRSPELRFFGGYWACPGGGLEPVDGSGDEAWFACARRELEEEIALRVEHLGYLGERTTPPFAPVRYKTRFFEAELPLGAEPRIASGELVEGRFFAPAEALASWSRGELWIVPPVLSLLEALLAPSREEFRARWQREEREIDSDLRLPPIRFTPGLFVAALRTATLPPATTTNTILVGHDPLYVVDPATAEESEQQRLFRELDARIATGARIAGVLVTHHHPDHVGAVAETAARYDVPVIAHPLTLERLPRPPQRTRAIEDGAVIELGTAPDGSPRWHLTAYHTPGHDRGHLVFLESRYRALIGGDLASTVSTIVIDPPEGHLATYLASLRRMQELGIGFFYPSHGPSAPHGKRLLASYLAHRAMRETALLDALKDGVKSPAELLPVVYADTDPRLHGLAARSLRAGLEKLVEDGRVCALDAERFELLPAAQGREAEPKP
ncbi:MAG: MBL fold metallo-hydrolase [Planctomycetes bacterium]|nr:MBL fold metallo-hydrolase [Planctomycetota bacterium]